MTREAWIKTQTVSNLAQSGVSVEAYIEIRETFRVNSWAVGCQRGDLLDGHGEAEKRTGEQLLGVESFTYSILIRRVSHGCFEDPILRPMQIEGKERCSREILWMWALAGLYRDVAGSARIAKSPESIVSALWSATGEDAWTTRLMSLL